MPWLLARVGPREGPNRRRLTYRGEEHLDEVGPAVHEAPEGALVLLYGAAPPWNKARTAGLSDWPGLPHPRALWAAREPQRAVQVLPWLASYGRWCKDPRGAPCEIGRGRDSGELRWVLNYAGWRFDDFPAEPVEVWPTRASGELIWIVPPASVPCPLAGEPEPGESREPGDFPEPGDSWGPGGSRKRGELPEPGGSRKRGELPEPGDETLPLRAEPTIRTRHLRQRYRYEQVEFEDGAVRASLAGRWYRIVSRESRALWNVIRAELDQAFPEGLVMDLELGDDGAYEARMSGLEQGFGELAFRRWLRRSTESNEWLEGRALVRACKSEAKDEELEALIDVPELGLQRRAEAFRHLFTLRERARQVLWLPGRQLIIPIADPCGGGPWYAWEIVEEGHATYLFRPTDETATSGLFAWIQSDLKAKRVGLLGDKALQRELGFEGRAIHADLGAGLQGWKDQLHRILGAKG